MAVPTAALGAYRPSKIRSVLPTQPKIAAQVKPKPALPPISISTNPHHVNLDRLTELYAACNHSGHRFPTVDAAGRVEPVDKIKLRTALSHSSVVISAFTKHEILTGRSFDSTEATDLIGVGGNWIRKVAPVTPGNGRLIGFGRAVSDLALTASIYDVMVHPALQGRGIGRMIIKRIVRMLTNTDIYDIAALCASNESRLFFSACGFGDDILGSTTMMYTRPVSCYSEDEQIVYAGRKLLLVPPLRDLIK